MGEECMPDGEWPSLDFDLDMGSDFDLDDLGSLEDLLDADFEREFEDFKRDAESGAWNTGKDTALPRRAFDQAFYARLQVGCEPSIGSNRIRSLFKPSKTPTGKGFQSIECHFFH